MHVPSLAAGRLLPGSSFAARCPFLVAIAITVFALPHPSRAAQTTATWVGPGGSGASGNWGVADNWSPAVVPNNNTPAGTTYRVVINTANTDVVVTIPDNGIAYTVDALTIGAGDTLSLTFSAVLTVVNSGPGTGTIANGGTIALGNNPGFTSPGTLVIGGEVTLSGGGNVRLVSATTSNSIHGSGVASRLINVDNTISGSGRIGGFEANYMGLTNRSTIVANQSAGLSIASNPNAGGVINTGAFLAENGATLTLDTNSNLNVGSFDNASGVVRANAGIVRVSSSGVTGGTVETVGAGEIQLASGSVTGGTLTNSGSGVIRSRFGGTNRIGGAVTNPAGGTIIIERSGGSLTLTGGSGNTYENGGNIAFGTGSGEASLIINGDVSLTGGGTVTFGNLNTSAITGSPSTSHLTNVNNTISGAGQLGGTFGTLDGTMRFTNQGTVVADQTNNLVLKATPAETGLNTSGRVQVNAGSTMRVDASTVLTQNAGSTIVNGTLALNGDGRLQLNGGTLVGTDTVSGNVVNAAGTVAPGLSPGKLTIKGGFTQEENGTLAIEVRGVDTAGSDFDLLAVSGTAALDGTLQLINLSGFTPDSSDKIVPLTAAAVTGTFSSTNTQVIYGSDGITVAALAGQTPQSLLNISTRLRVGTGENALIGGIIITGTEAKRVIIRAIGPALAGEGVAGVLQDPTLELFDGAGNAITSNDNWKDTQQSEIEATTIPPRNDAESAIVRSLAPGNYTAVVRGKNDSTGIGLVEVYDLAQAAQSQLANISSRGFVESGENVLIGGFIVGGGSGTVRVVIRAIGPALANEGVAGALQDPTLELADANGATVRANDNWKSDQQAELEALSIQPSNDLESALVAPVSAGNYTAIVRGKSDGTGVGLVEVYNVQ